MLTVLHAPAEVKASGWSQSGDSLVKDEIKERLRHPIADGREVPLRVGHGQTLCRPERRHCERPRSFAHR
jgi:hypothetical protein